MATRLFIIMLLLIFINGCATLSKNECATGNWFFIGKKDGKYGRTSDYIDKHVEACSEYKIEPDFITYEKGRNEGLKTYCTPHNGFELGKNLNIYSGVCPNELREDFLTTYVSGVEYAKSYLEENESEIKNEIRNIESYLSYSEGDDKKLKKKLKSARSSLKTSQRKMIKADEVLAEYSKYKSPSLAEKLLKITVETAVDTAIDSATDKGLGKLFNIFSGKKK